MAELVDALGLGPSAIWRGGSSPLSGTISLIINSKNIYRSNIKKYKKNKNNKLIKTIIFLGIINILIVITRVILFVWNNIIKTILSQLAKCCYFIFNSFIFKLFVKLYFAYYRINKKFFKKIKGNFFAFILNQKLVHVLVVIITIFITFINLTAKTKASSLTNTKQNKPLITQLVKSEFDFEEEELTEEYFDDDIYLAEQHNYLDNVGILKKQPIVNPNLSNNQSDQLAVNPEKTAIVKQDIIVTKKTKQPRDKIIYYTVKPGDTVSTIAQKFEISVNTILWENNLSAYSIIRPGDKLAILPFSGVTHTIRKGDTLSKIAKRYNISEEKILKANKINDPSHLKIGKKLLIPGGTKRRYAVASYKSYSGISAIRNIVKAPSAKPVVGNKMNWPTVGHRITQYYSWRHHGLDIANRIGTPIYAADAGIIERAGWSRGYGYNIVINHGGGKKTRYAHLSKFYVKKGQRVSKGETIGAMGSTGWSTGPHLHFEVIINGRRYNPLNYIK